MHSITYIVLWVAWTTLPLWHYHADLYKTINYSQAAMALFCSINAMICFWELSLYYCRKLIKTHFNSMLKTLPAGTLPQPMFLFEHVKLSQAFTLQHWSKVWSTYSLMDPSYSDSMSFGFWVDIGNGHVTLLPTILFALGMTFDFMPARVLGTISFAAFWQMFYGTVLYFLSYFYNERWRGRPGLPIVIASNAVWLAGPFYGMYLSYDMVMTDTCRLVRT